MEHLEKLIVTQLVKKYPVFYGIRRFVTVFTRALKYLGTTLSSGNYIHGEIRTRINCGSACYHAI
jgi:hypothetical protein